jgi:hypothetical protein
MVAECAGPEEARDGESEYQRYWRNLSRSHVVTLARAKTIFPVHTRSRMAIFERRRQVR